MTVRAIAGLTVLNLAFLGVGASLLWGVRGWRWWTELFRLAGVAYLLGVASLTVVLTLEIVLDIPFGPVTFLASAAGVAVAGFLLGALRDRSRPGFQPPGWRLAAPSLLAASFAGAIVLYFEGLFRSARLLPLLETDAWWVWTIQAKALYLFGHLGGGELVRETNLSYPPGLSLLHAEGFEAIGGIDTVTLHVQHWYLAVGFVAAIVGLLAGRVRTAILFPFVLLMLVMPGFADHSIQAMADCLLGYLASVGGLLLCLWLEDRARWRLELATVLLAGAMLTKREGVIVVLCVVAAAFVAAGRERRWAWPRLAVATAFALVLAAPWRIWLTATGAGDAPTGGYFDFLDHADRAWPSLELVVRTLLHPMWFGFGALAVIAPLLALASGVRKLPVFALTFLVASVTTSAFVIWSETLFEISQRPSGNPVLRMVLVTMLVVAPLTPLLLETAWRRGSPASAPSPPSVDRGPGSAGATSILAWAILGVALVVYPASMLVGYSGLALPGGAPRFPGPDECVKPVMDGSTVRVVLGYEETYAEANALRSRALDADLGAADVAQDGCGRLRVFLDDIPTANADRTVSAAEAADFDPSLENDPDG